MASVNPLDQRTLFKTVNVIGWVSTSPDVYSRTKSPPRAAKPVKLLDADTPAPEYWDILFTNFSPSVPSATLQP